MKKLFLSFIILFALQSYAQVNQQEMMKKAKLLSSKFSNSKGKGVITYTAKGKTYTEKNEISTVIINNQIGDISNDKHTVSIGDGNVRSFKVGKSYVCKVLIVMIDGKQYSRRSSSNIATITFFDGKTIKGTFSGTVYNEKTKETIPVTGSFQTENITSI